MQYPPSLIGGKCIFRFIPGVPTTCVASAGALLWNAIRRVSLMHCNGLNNPSAWRFMEGDQHNVNMETIHYTLCKPTQTSLNIILVL
jgi:hypothetical protein